MHKIEPHRFQSTVELGYNVMKGTEYLVSLQTSVVTTNRYNAMVNSEELIDITEHLTIGEMSYKPMSL
jgi:hypothetical protein